MVLAITLVPQYSYPLRTVKISHVHSYTFPTRHALRPRERLQVQPSYKLAGVACRYCEGVGRSISNLRGSITSTTVYGPLVSLLTHDSCCHLHEPKTQSKMQWVLLSCEDLHLWLYKRLVAHRSSVSISFDNVCIQKGIVILIVPANPCRIFLNLVVKKFEL